MRYIDDMTIAPIAAMDEFDIVSSAEELFSAATCAIYPSAVLNGIRWEQDQREISANFLSIPNAIVVVDDHHIIYMTAKCEFLSALYPKPWPYAKFKLAQSDALSLDIDTNAALRLTGDVFMPFSVAGNWFHMLFDNYARLFFRERITPNRSLTTALPFWACPGGRAAHDDRAIIHSVFLRETAVLPLQRGVYEVERLIAPPLGNVSDYIFTDPARFVSNRLRSDLRCRKVTHPLRIFVSRADIGVRNLSNEAELVFELRRLGFMIICPGDYSFLAQLELFASAEIIAGVHGQGMTPMIAAAGCRAILEFEAAGWAFTAYRSIAGVLNVPYYKLPCEMTEMRNPSRFDWLARADIPACMAILRGILEQTV
jgi:capsular polysaccharide biosynthesis protein